ncbi:MAG: hypothetical protein A2830_00525 [Candidatus Taylorbacteria bacterium RIFCSPHIGHO2_01_FULL_44_110]|uniref:MurNAc-LAA domain-containing protein n=1 Tax=Candidatus Taylorbacteria bacterium RIFCSPHIGHO2_12_FULL_45_16 TaxID=1802315 RepID=A0A1G2N371_9BACT|nr:MAG: hypothetical protein A2830_00525 [Candidatus Taylorbacteria bacterium RIFCSPHIGHO2_01_FULL_44_110]OHA29711.1 MAG: hypothetical protein A3F51_03220 [Candidatus Taylorbacteria bacterium RIFCSPHIGHO2_12_FULL_45_16]OHA32655.1 MAG: hypothetical protein A3A23_00090 [Candidatus Taylorbacteria bacterium RIFCSPLOWO2_01_FULL_45_59]OHA38808.1 MAG: hypothetical protein A3I98_01525 [Candidatus Taylorbacteria bacterium RIFCSPLOWO2_02_FULL_45_10b]
MRHYIALALLVTIFTAPWLATTFPEQADYVFAWMKYVGDQVAAVVAHNPRTIDELQKKYASSTPRKPHKIRVLIVPGHEPDYGGAEFGVLKERDMTIELGEQLALFLSANEKYEVIMSRTKQEWSPVFAEYFDRELDDIIVWQKAHKEESLRRVVTNQTSSSPKVYHNSAPDSVAYRLYGLTKWSNENAVDIAIHIHFNDYPGHGRIPGKYAGFAIYTPEAQYANSTTTRALSETMFKRLSKYNPVSNLPVESDGIIEERELIAIGANNTADAASALIEYGYMYEPQFLNIDTRGLAIKDLAFQTYLGLEDFFNPRGVRSLAATYDTLVLPYIWRRILPETSRELRDIYALQTALQVEGVYPPQGKDQYDCPRTGKIGPCTKSSVEVFQKKYGIEENGVGEKTIGELNRLYSGRSL